MAYYSDLATSSNELYAYEVSLEHFKELLDLSYEMLEDLYSKMHSQRDFAISLQSYSIALSHLSKSVNKYHPQIPYLEVPALESMSVEDSLSLEGFVDFIKAIWEKIVAFFRALWEFIGKIFSTSSSKKHSEINKKIKATLDKASQEKEEVKDELIEKINEHFKVVTPRLIRSKKFVDKDTIDYTTYLEVVEELITLIPSFFEVFNKYQLFNSELLNKGNNIIEEIKTFVRNPDLSKLEKKEHIHPLELLKDKLKSISNELFEKYCKDNRLEEINLSSLPKEIKDFYNKNIHTVFGLEKETVRIYKVLDLDKINNNLTLYLFHYNVENSAIFHHRFVTKSMIKKDGSLKEKISNEYINPSRVNVNVDFESFANKTQDTLRKIEAEMIIISPMVDKIKEEVTRKLTKEEEENIEKITENIYYNYYEYMMPAIMETDNDELIDEYDRIYRPDGVILPPEKRELNVKQIKLQFTKLLIDFKSRLWFNLASLASVISVNCINVLELFNKEKEYLEKIMDFAIEEGKKKLDVSKNNS